MKMLIMRGIAGNYALPGGKPRYWPRGALDEPAALEFARLRGYKPKVLDVAGTTGANSPQTTAALKEIRADDEIFALYGFSGGGYNAYHIIKALKPKELERLALVVVLGAPKRSEHSYRGTWELIYRLDPPAGHMAGPRALLARPYAS
jgi:hypothetical protein